MKFSIVIPTWNNLALLKLCVASIQKNSSENHQIIIHVNDGHDGSLEWVKQSGLDYTSSPENVGICFAMNQAAALATTEYILYLNDDMYCCPGWDQNLMKRLSEVGDRPFMLSGTMIEPRATGNACVVVADYGSDPSTFKEEALLQNLSSLNRTDWLGSTWPPVLMRKKDWDLIGGFSTELSPGMSSDNDLSMKMWHMGCRIFLGVGDSFVYHFMSKSTGKVVKNNGRSQFLHKWGMTHAVFDRHYLRRGRELPKGSDIVLSEPTASLKFKLDLLKCRLKRLVA